MNHQYIIILSPINFLCVKLFFIHERLDAATLSVKYSFENYDKDFSFFFLIGGKFCEECIFSQEHTEGSVILCIMCPRNGASKHCRCHMAERRTSRERSCRHHGILVCSRPHSCNNTQSLGILLSRLKSRT